ncbi:MAG: stage III sporulation protein AC [Clostridiales bacterium]|nr:stage III sporulation protein AC [Clostridiales bacterium]
MEIEFILRIAIIGILITLINQILKQAGRDELAFLSSLVGLIIVILQIIPYISDLITTLQRLFNLS